MKQPSKTPPPILTPKGAEYWRIFVPEVVKGGWNYPRYTVTYMAADQMAIYELAAEEIALNKITLENGKKNPAVSTQKQAMDQAIKALAALNVLNPVAVVEQKPALETLRDKLRGSDGAGKIT